MRFGRVAPGSFSRSQWGRSRFAKRRLTARLSQEELAAAAGVPLGTVKRLDRNAATNPAIRPLMRCADVLGCTVDDLVEEHWKGGPTDGPPRSA